MLGSKPCMAEKRKKWRKLSMIQHREKKTWKIQKIRDQFSKNV